MPDKFVFSPAIDLPLAVATLLGFILHFNAWARSSNADTAVDLVARLAKARIRVVCLITLMVCLCWFMNFALWGCFAILLGAGIAVAIIGGDVDGGGFGLLLAGYAIREWAFGFPQLILQPPETLSQDVQVNERLVQLKGKRGTTVSPLRPCGEADIDGQQHNVISDDGQLLDINTEVIVTGIRNGVVCVRTVGENGE